MKLISEFNDQQLEVITEQKDGKKKLYIEGVFAQAEKKNRNGRVYPMAIMEKAVGKYVDDQVSQSRSRGVSKTVAFPITSLPLNSRLSILCETLSKLTVGPSG